MTEAEVTDAGNDQITLSPLRRLSLAGLVLLVGGGGIAHFLVPDSYLPLIPVQLGNARAWVYASGVAEAACGALLIVPKTRRIGAWATIAILILVFPGNIKMALDGGVSGAAFPANSATASWIRLPFQALFVWWAWTFARHPMRNHAKAREVLARTADN